MCDRPFRRPPTLSGGPTRTRNDPGTLPYLIIGPPHQAPPFPADLPGGCDPLRFTKGDLNPTLYWRGLSSHGCAALRTPCPGAGACHTSPPQLLRRLRHSHYWTRYRTSHQHRPRRHQPEGRHLASTCGRSGFTCSGAPGRNCKPRSSQTRGSEPPSTPPPCASGAWPVSWTTQ